MVQAWLVRDSPHPHLATATGAEISIKTFAGASGGKTLSAGRTCEPGTAGEDLATVGGKPRNQERLIPKDIP